LTGAAQIIAKRIEGRGPISFAEFMQVALYCPVYGYYEKEEDSIGRGGDYYTSVSVGPLFGELLAFQFAAWLGAQAQPEALASPRGGPAKTLQIVEAGAHRGHLARDILSWMRQQRPELFERLDYWIIEPSERRRQWQQQTLPEFAGKVRWANTLSELSNPDVACNPPDEPPTARQPPSPFPLPVGGGEGGRWPGGGAGGIVAQATGLGNSNPASVARRSSRVQRIIFANELLDAFPVRRLGWDALRQTWFEWGVALKHGRFVWTRLADTVAYNQPASPTVLDPHLSALLPDGFTMEVCPAAMEWWRAAAGVLEWGKLLTIDYGLSAEQFLAPERKKGTVRAYRRHQVNDDVLANPGAQDITANVNFSALQAAGESAGLQTEAFLTQAKFLTLIAAEAWKRTDSFGDWTPQRTRQFQTLTHPEHLGRPFRVLVQGRG
jgi:SAM-dependent MidA family methyltransferase